MNQGDGSVRCGRWHPSACGTPLGGCPPRALPLPGSPPHSQAHMLCRHHRHHTPTHTQPPLRRPARRPHPAPCLTHEDLAVGAVGHLHLARVVQQEDAAGQAGWGGKQGRRCELHWWWWSAWRRRPGVCADREARKEAVRGRWVSSDGAGALRRRPGADGDEAATGAARGAHARQRGGGGTSSAGLALRQSAVQRSRCLPALFQVLDGKALPAANQQSSASWRLLCDQRAVQRPPPTHRRHPPPPPGHTLHSCRSRRDCRDRPIAGATWCRCSAAAPTDSSADSSQRVAIAPRSAHPDPGPLHPAHPLMLPGALTRVSPFTFANTNSLILLLLVAGDGALVPST